MFQTSATYRTTLALLFALTPKSWTKKSNLWGLLMEKYSYELKKKIVEEYLSGKSSYRDLAMKYQIENLFLDYG